jgi:hypothetical protein
MTSRTAAARYARALLDVATKESADLDKIARELDEVVAFFGQQTALERLLLNPAVPAPRKRAAMEQITRLSQQTPNVSKLLVLLADPQSRAMMFLPALLQSLLFGYGATYDLTNAPYAVLDLSRGAASRSGPSIRSVSSDTSPSQFFTRSRSTSYAGGSWSGHKSTSQSAAIA